MAKAKAPRTNGSSKTTKTTTTPAETQLAATPEVTMSETKSVRKPETRKNVIPINLDEEIRRRAYELSEQRGFEPGHENDDWLVAEREVLARYTQQQSA